MDFDDIHVESLKKPQQTDLAQRARAVHYTNKMPTMPVATPERSDSHLKARMIGYYKRLTNWLRGLEQLEADTSHKDVTKASEPVDRYN